MKKLIVMLGVAISAVALQAATITWTVAGVKSYADPSVSGSGYAAYLFYTESSVSADTTVALTDVVAAITGGTFANNYASKAIFDGTTGTSGNITKTGLGSYGTGDSVSAFTVVFDAGSYADASHYAIVDGKTASFTSATGAKTLAFTNYSTSAQWADIAPEPTSGLMILLGMGVLALRRRRA